MTASLTIVRKPMAQQSGQPELADLTLIKQRKQPARGRGPGRPFAKGHSGNPAGRPRGARDKINRIAESLLDSGSEALTRKAMEMALDGKETMLKACLDRVLPPRRERTVNFAMPQIRGPGDLAAAMGAVANAAADGAITPGEAVQFGQMIEAMVRAIQTTEFERRLRQVEPAQTARR